jgi:hypothetical protein
MPTTPVIPLLTTYIPFQTGGSLGFVSCLAVYNGQVYIGGQFGYFQPQGGGPSVARANFTVFDSTNNYQLGPFAPGFENPVADFTLLGNVLYVAGSFINVNGSHRGGACQINLNTQTLLSWDPQPTLGAERALTGITVNPSGTKVFVIGDWVTWKDGSTRHGAASVDNTGALLPWDPGIQIFGFLPLPAVVRYDPYASQVYLSA